MIVYITAKARKVMRSARILNTFWKVSQEDCPIIWILESRIIPILSAWISIHWYVIYRNREAMGKGGEGDAIQNLYWAILHMRCSWNIQVSRKELDFVSLEFGSEIRATSEGIYNHGIKERSLKAKLQCSHVKRWIRWEGFSRGAWEAVDKKWKKNRNQMKTEFGDGGRDQPYQDEDCELPIEFGRVATTGLQGWWF